MIAQGQSGKRPGTPVEALGSISNGLAASVGISRLSAPVQASDMQPNRAAVGMQASTSRNQDTSAAHTDLSSHPGATGHLKTAVSDVAKAPAHAAAGRSQQGHSRGEGLLGAAGSQQLPAETAADGINSLYYNLGTADRPLSSFAQRGGSTGAARPAGGDSRAAAGELGGSCHSQQDVQAEAGAKMAMNSAPAAGKQTVDGLLSSAAALTGTEMLPGQHQEGYSTEPLLTARQHEQGYSAAAPNTIGHVGQHHESFMAEVQHAASLLQPPGNQPDLAGFSPQENMLWFKGRDSTQQCPVSDTGLSPHPAQWQTEDSPDSIQHQAAAPAGAAGHDVTANRQQPTLGHDAGHVAAGPSADMGDLLPAATGSPTLAHDAAASSQSGASAAAARGPNVKFAAEDVGAASPSGFSSSFLGQSLDLSKVSFLIGSR